MGRRTSLASTLLICAWVSFGCFSTGRIDIRANDRDALNPGARVSWQAYPRDPSQRKSLLETIVPAGAAAQNASSELPEAPAAPASPEATERVSFQPLVSIDVEYRAGVSAKDQRSIEATRFVDYDGTRFLGPQIVDYDYTLHAGTIGGRGGIRVYEILAIEGLVGLTTSALQLEVRGSGDRTSDTGVGLGAHLGARATVSPHRVFDVFGQYLFHVLGGLQSDRDEILMRTIDVAGNLHLTSNLSLFGGWRWWAYEERIEHDSDVDVELSGPAFGVLLRF